MEARTGYVWKLLSVLVMPLLLVIVPLTGNAEPLTFRFEMPKFEEGDSKGETSVLDLTVDNGGVSAANQQYRNTQIVAARVRIGDEAADWNHVEDAYLLRGDEIWITTDLAGTPTLNLAQPVYALIKWVDLSEPTSVTSIQLASGVTGAFAYSVRVSARRDGYIRSGFEVSGLLLDDPRGSRWIADEGGNGHYYKVVHVPDRISWTQANEDALRLAENSHLATMTSEQEDEFVGRLLSSVDVPSGTTQGAWVGAIQIVGAAAPDEGWRWITGEPFEYTNWVSGQPDDLYGDSLYMFIEAEIPGYGWWDHGADPPPYDLLFNYVVEIPPPKISGMEVTVRTTPYWKEVGKIDRSSGSPLFVAVVSGGPVDPTTIDFDTFEVEEFPRSALRGISYDDKNGDGLPDYNVWYRLDRALQLDCCEYDQRFSAMTTDGLSLTGRLKFEVVGCTP